MFGYELELSSFPHFFPGKAILDHSKGEKIGEDYTILYREPSLQIGNICTDAYLI